ncbi:hypothetical protein [Thermobacillus sp.]|nr:hypothetical protein [Thermobacillus sp.]
MRLVLKYVLLAVCCAVFIVLSILGILFFSYEPTEFIYMNF